MTAVWYIMKRRLDIKCRYEVQKKSAGSDLAGKSQLQVVLAAVTRIKRAAC